MATLEELVAIIKKEKEDGDTTYTSPWKAVGMVILILSTGFFYESDRISTFLSMEKSKIPMGETRTLIDEWRERLINRSLCLLDDLAYIKKKANIDKVRKVEDTLMASLSEEIVLFGEDNKKDVRHVYLSQVALKQDRGDSDRDKTSDTPFSNDLSEKKPPEKSETHESSNPIQTMESHNTLSAKDLISDSDASTGGLEAQKDHPLDPLIESPSENNDKESLIADTLLTKVSHLSPPYNVLMIGDSMMGGYVGILIQHKLMKLKGSRVHRKGVVSTGLAFPNYYNWDKKLEKLIQKRKTNVLIVMIGTNDFHSLYSLDRKRYIRFESKDWKGEYTKATMRMMEIAKRHKLVTFWIGLPITEKAHLNHRIKAVNAIHEESAGHFKNIHYIPLWKMFKKEKGRFMTYIKNTKGQRVRIRTRDGIHLNRLASQTASRYVLKGMSKYIKIP
ncbi:MAG TPA: DUF459 domain-containing protein [Spirochaetes bacterium]|nr:DUF459 domain-containing protein [Spirochaetota bacterium]